MGDMATADDTMRDRGRVARSDFERHRRGIWNGWFLGNIVEIHGPEQENILLMFTDPANEQAYSDYFNRTHLRNDLLGIGVSLGVALLFSSKADFGSFPAKVLRHFVVLAVTLNSAWFFTALFAPGFALKYRNPAVYILSWSLHAVVACLPPLTYHSYKTPTTAFAAYMVRTSFLMRNHRKWYGMATCRLQTRWKELNACECVCCRYGCSACRLQSLFPCRSSP